MKIKITVELEQEIADTDIIKELYQRQLESDFKEYKEEVIQDLKNDDWDKVTIIEFSIENINPNKFHSNKPIK